jgi:vancomycin resistance protein YoaR
LENGWLVAPGDVFSYNAYIGPITKKNGYVTGLGILADGEGGITTGPVVGGGVCQVSTTVFQAAFWAGLSIEERWSHPYWIQTYGQPPSGMQGLDAMINVDDDPGLTLDLKFRNTTDNWIAVVVKADGQNVSTEIRGTNPGWQVKVDDSVVSNVVQPDPEPIYTDSPEIPAGEERQVETAQQGFDATVRRQVLDKDGALVDEYTYTSTYVPALNRFLRGVGSGN